MGSGRHKSKYCFRNRTIRFAQAGKWCPCCNKVKMTKFKNTYGQIATIDHILPLSMMGNNNTANLKVICEDCNQKKNASFSLLEVLPLFTMVINTDWRYAPKDLAVFSLAKHKNFMSQLRKHGVMM